MATKFRAKSTIKLVGDSGISITWTIPAGQSLERFICDMITFNSIDVESARRSINAALDAKEDASNG